MNWQSSIALAESRIRAWAAQQVANVVEWAPVVLASSDGATDAIDGPPSDESSQRDVIRVPRAGFRSRAVAKVGALIVKQGTRYFQVAEDDGADVALDSGEAVHYAPDNVASIVRCKPDGSTTIGSDTGNGKDTSVNGGTSKVGRVGDAVKARAAFAAWMAQVEGFINGTVPGTVAPLSPTFKDLLAEIAAGADHFKA